MLGLWRLHPLDAFRKSHSTRSEVCRACERIRFVQCGQEKAQAEFDAEARYNFFTRKQNVCCIACRDEGLDARGGTFRTQGTEQVCTVCGETQKLDAFRTSHERRLAVCKTCERILCNQCGMEKAQAEFGAKDRLNFFTGGQYVCCSACRASGRDARGSTFCAAGTGRACTRCGLEKTLAAFRKRDGKPLEVCRTCELLPCAACKADRPQTSFEPKSVENHLARGSTLVCRECTARGCSARDVKTYLCEGPCQEHLGHNRFGPGVLGGKRKPQHQVICLQCVQTEKDRQQEEKARQARLTKLLRTSTRAACKCKRQAGHTEKCPMHPRTAGEDPYPGCDVLSREDSEWLHSRKRKKPT